MDSKKIIVLGAAGAVGSVAARTLCKCADMANIEKVVLADIDLEKVNALAKEFGKIATPIQVDVLNKQALSLLVEDADVVLNCVGPFYKFVEPILSTVMQAGTDYVDVCDDVDVTLRILNQDNVARSQNMSAVIGMGNSPGIPNLLARFAADFLFDRLDAVDIYHVHGGEEFEGPGVIAHRFHCMSMEIPQYINGEMQFVRFFEESGKALRTKTNFPHVGENITVYPYPHPEQVTLPKYLSLKQVTNRGTVLPEEYYDLTTKIVEAGLHSKDPVEVNGQKVIPYDFSIAYLIQKRDEMLKKMNFGSRKGCLKVVVSGQKRKKQKQYEFIIASSQMALGEGTGIPAAMATLLMAQGKIHRKGVFPPEAGINPLDFFKLIKPVLKSSNQDKSFGGLEVYEIKKGKRKPVSIEKIVGKAMIAKTLKNIFRKTEEIQLV
ncbi:MAG: saccharopine dehydrogenase [Candidatus Hydrogenedentota bacterium]|nr:MAG: saccharopine dehydrogenase [Candidatus Hydrogenedentota bacterium]